MNIVRGTNQKIFFFTLDLCLLRNKDILVHWEHSVTTLSQNGQNLDPLPFVRICSISVTPSCESSTL